MTDSFTSALPVGITTCKSMEEIHSELTNIFFRSSVEEHFHSRIPTKDGLQHFSVRLGEADLKESQLRGVREAVSESVLPVKLSWSHPDPTVCPSSLAKYLSQKGLKVRERNCQLESHVMNSVTVPEGWTDEDVEELVHWVAGVSLRLSLPLPSLPYSEGSVASVLSSGLLSVRTVSHLITSASSLLRDHHLPWLAVAVHGPRYKLKFSGKILNIKLNASL